MNNTPNDKFDLFDIYRRGWIDGASHTTGTQSNKTHHNKTVRKVYYMGLQHGHVAYMAMMVTGQQTNFEKEASR